MGADPGQAHIIETVSETGSTNADLAERIARGEAVAEGYWLRAEIQTGGRGRHGRNWLSPRGNLHCSTAVRLQPGDPAAHTLSFVAALAVYDMLSQSLLPDTPVMLKWPNDALAYGDKIAGILAERTGDYVVIGIGVNVCHAPDIPGRQTTSILHLNGKRGGSPELVLGLLAERFAARLSAWRRHGQASTLSDWRACAHPEGTGLSVSDEQGEAIAGSFAGLDDDGALMLRRADGTMQTLRAGDVALVPAARTGEERAK